jgi:predicted transport protein
MDSLGIDENGSPVIIEYKRSSNENVINQGLFYLDWLMDHRKDFEWLVLERYGKQDASTVDWESPRLICIAGDFTKYDAHAVNQMNRNIELVRYRRFGDDLLLFELLTSTSESASDAPANKSDYVGRQKNKQKTFSQLLGGADQDLTDLYESVKAFLVALGDDVQIKVLENYVAFRRLKNFACVEIKPQIRHLKVYVKVSPMTIGLEQGFTRDVSKIGHFGTGDLEIIIVDNDSFERAKPLMEQSYDNA